MQNKLKWSKKAAALLCGLCCLSANHVAAQVADTARMSKLEQKVAALEKSNEKQQRLKVSGYVQAQYQYGEQDASLKVGGANENPDKGFHRIGIRRGRIKFAYEGNVAMGVFQLDITEKGVGFKDAYLGIKDPWLKSASMIKVGVFDRPFGHEISYSSSVRESPERSAIFQTLFPDERDLGAMIQIQTSKNSAWNFLKLEAGLFAGNGIKMETDNRKDFIGHLSAAKTLGSAIQLGGGVSYYYGGAYQGTENIYKMQGNGFILDSNDKNRGDFAKREYVGFDFQFSAASVIGKTQLRAEYLFGQQPGAKSNSKSPNASTLPATDMYIRKFQGGYVILVQDLGMLPLSAVLKYDWYDPNTRITGNEIGLLNSAVGDVASQTFGFGLLWQATSDIRLQAYYEINKNEKSSNLAGYHSDRKDNVFTLRVQYKF